jgi:hypothetical protein
MASQLKRSTNDEYWGSHLVQMCNVGQHIAEPPEGWFDRGDCNRASCWNSIEEAEACARPGERSSYDLYAFRVVPVVFTEGAPAVVPTSGLFPPGDTAFPQEHGLEGFVELGWDVVQYSDKYYNHGCSPLWCNGRGSDYPVNQYCLLNARDAAWAAALDFSSPDAPNEVGPYIIWQVLRRQDAE